MIERAYIQKLHSSTSRDYLSRMNDNKVEAMKIAREYDFDYWDGDRRYGYGGYRYIAGRWKDFAASLIQDYKLTNDSRILDIGMGKGYLLYEVQLLLPNIEIFGLDISSYAIQNRHPELKGEFRIQEASKLDFEDNYFDLTFSINTLHNLKLKDCVLALSEMNRVSSSQYVVVESFRNEREFFNLQCWALTANLLLSVEDWKTVFNQSGYKGDYEWIFFE
jgi:ubiquinone/menaquinone biosynthesis C-methylase UbiE